MKKVLIAILACSALLVGTTACGTTNNTTSSTNSTTETTSLSSFPSNKSGLSKPENISTADDAKKLLKPETKLTKMVTLISLLLMQTEQICLKTGQNLMLSLLHALIPAFHPN